MKKIFIGIIVLLLHLNGFTQKSLLQSGPMVGYSEMLEVAIWIQTNDSAIVKMAYWPIGNPDDRSYSNNISTNKENAFTALLIADNLEPGNKYEYEIFINNVMVDLP